MATFADESIPCGGALWRGVLPLATWAVRGGATLVIARGSVVHFEGGEGGCIVNATNAGCLRGAGVDGAVNSAGGDAMYAAREALPQTDGRRCAEGGSVCTGPGAFGSLKVPYVMHSVGPNYGRLRHLGVTDADGDARLASAYASAFKLAEERELSRLASCMISSGVYVEDATAAAAAAAAAVSAAATTTMLLHRVRYSTN